MNRHDEEQEGEAQEASPKTTWMLCPVCEGRGTTVNPDIDGNGLTRENFDEDPDFAEDYMSGVYDVTCRCCQGRTTIQVTRMDELRQNAADRELAYREDGVYDPSYNPRDYRYG